MTAPRDFFYKDAQQNEKKFWSKVHVRELQDCWEWKGFKSNGYGSLYIRSFSGRAIFMAHRVSFVLKNKKDLVGNILICHKCDNPICCNPNHLFSGTHTDNMLDMKAKNRTRGKRVRVNNVNFPSAASASRHFGIGSETAVYRCQNKIMGWSYV